jgi:hypothetical protein
VLARNSRNARRAAAICACRTGNARLSHVGAGDSLIIVRGPSLSTTWKSSSDSWRINSTLAITVKMCRSNGSLVSGKLAGAGREVRNAIVVCSAGSSVGRSCSVLTVQRSTPHSTRPLEEVPVSTLAAAKATSTRTTAAKERPATNRF